MEEGLKGGSIVFWVQGGWAGAPLDPVLDPPLGGVPHHEAHPWRQLVFINGELVLLTKPPP